MTVSTLTSSVTYVGNGSTTQFAVPFKVLDEDHLVVKRRLLSTNEIDHTYLGTDYSYSGIGSDSGTLTLAGTALSSLYQLEIERIVPYTQELDIVNTGGFYPETVEEQLDLTTMQVQQIAAQSDDIETRALMVPVGSTAPDYADFASAFKGDPGGNIESIGLFEALALGLTERPLGTDRFHTSGFSEPGVGDADYVNDDEVDAAYVIANPLTSFLWADGTGARLNAPVVTPWMFGPTVSPRLPWVEVNGAQALPPDNLAALEAFFEYCATSTRDFIADWDAVWGISATLEVDLYRARPRTYRCGTLVALAPMTNMMSLSHSYSTFEGRLGLAGGGYLDDTTAYGSRTVENGLLCVNSNNARIEQVHVSNVKNKGIHDELVEVSDNIMLRIDYVRAFGCGAYHVEAFGQVNVAFTARVDSGTTGHPDQRSTLTVASSAALRAGSLVKIGSSVRYLTDIPNGTSVKVWPWLPTGVTSGTIESMHGGAVDFSNNNSTSVSIGRIDAFHSGVTLWSGGLYGISYEQMQSQVNSVSIALGSVTASEYKTNLGSLLGRTHSEGNAYEMVVLSPLSTWTLEDAAVFGSENPHWLANSLMLRPMDSGTPLTESRTAGVTRGGINRHGHYHSSKHDFIGSGNNGDATISNEQPAGVPIFLNNNFTVYLEWHEDYNRFFPGNAVAQIIIMGTGADGEPTGTITVEPTSTQAAYTIGGAADLTITGATRRVHIIAIKEDGSDNWLVSWKG